ncbi:YihY/virulence factor BrkB family protein [Alphaproteobacteria bacterium]|nr:YihY/virulence factor BrkB family protein [Alphaproteobacteria bacterium]
MFGRFIRQIWRSALLSHALALALVSALVAGPWFIAAQTIFGVGQLNYGLHQIEESFVGQLIERAEAFFEPFGSLVLADIASNSTKAWAIFTVGLLVWLSFIMRALTRMHPTGAASLPGRFVKRWVSALNLPIVGLLSAFAVVWSLGKMTGPPLDFAHGQFGAVFGILAVVAASVFLFFLYGWLPRWKAGFLVRALISFSIAFVVLGLTAASKYALTVYHLGDFLQQGKFAFMALLIWSFLTWLAVLLGAQLIIFFSAENAMAEIPVTAAQEMDLALATLRELGHLSEDRKWTSSERLSNQIGCKYAAAKQVLTKLEVHNLVKNNGKDSWGLVDDLGDVTMKDVGLAMGTFLDEDGTLRLSGMDPVTERSLQALSPEWDQDLYSAFKGRRPDLMELESQDEEQMLVSDLQVPFNEQAETETIDEVSLEEIDNEAEPGEDQDEPLELSEEADGLDITELMLGRQEQEDLPPPIPTDLTSLKTVPISSTDGFDENQEQEIAWFVDQRVVGDGPSNSEREVQPSSGGHPWFQGTTSADADVEEELEPVEAGSLDDIRKAIEAEARKS